MTNPVLAAALHHWPLTLATFLYFYEAYACWRDQNEPGVITFVAYGIANVGIIWGYFRLLATMNGPHH